MPLNYAALLREIGRGVSGFRDLDEDTAHALFAHMLDGEVPELELGGILIALRIKGEALAETRGFLRALNERVTPLAAPDGRWRPVLLPTYNGARRAANLTALLALLLQREGIPVLLHGLSGAALAAFGEDRGDEPAEPANDEQPVAALRFGRVTTDEVLAALNIAPAETAVAAGDLLASTRLAYIATQALAPGAAQVLALRARLGLRSSVHSLVKLIDPFGGAGFRVVSVSHPDYVRRMRELMVDTRADALLLRGTEGEPYANPRRRPLLERFARGDIVETVPAEEGTLAQLQEMPQSNDAGVTAAWIRAVLEGQVPVPAPIAAQVALCARGARHPV